MAKKATKNTSKEITNRPQDTTKRLTLSEKLMIRAEYLNTGKSSLAVAKMYGVSDNTVRLLAKDERLSCHDNIVATIKKNMAGSLYIIADKALTQVNEMIGKASARDAMIVAGTAIDKARLIEGQTTSNLGIAGIMSVIHNTPCSTE